MKRRAWFFAAVVLLHLLARHTSATSYRYPSFGPPVVVGDKLVFGDDFWEAHRLICIDRKAGAKQWEISDRSRILKPWFEADGRLIITSGSDLKKCDVASGKLTPLHDTGFEKCMAVIRNDAQVLVLGYRTNVDYLLAVDPETWSKRWETPRIDHVSANGSDVLLCVEGTRESVRGSPEGAFRLVKNSLAGISARTGKVLWRRPLTDFDFMANAIATPKEFIVATGNKVLCLSQADGRVLKEMQLADSPFAFVNFVSRGGKPLMWSDFTLSEVSVPELERRDLLYASGYYAHSIQLHGDIVLPSTLNEHTAWHIATGKKIWEFRGQWHESSVHEGFLYFGKPDRDGKTTSMNKIEITTGKIEKLYQEESKQSRD